MAIVQRYGGGLGTTVGIHLKPFTNNPELEILGLRVVQANLEPRRTIVAEIAVNGKPYSIDMVFWDETYQDRTDTGGLKGKHNDR